VFRKLQEYILKIMPFTNPNDNYRKYKCKCGWYNYYEEDKETELIIIGRGAGEYYIKCTGCKKKVIVGNYDYAYGVHCLWAEDWTQLSS
jgi:hypothetical protein